MRRGPSIAAFLLVVAAAGMSGCGETPKMNWPWNKPVGPGIDAWVVNEMERVTLTAPRRQDDLLVNPRTGAIDLFAASNETLSFQVVVQADDRPLRNVRIGCGELARGTKKITSENFRAYRLLPMRIADYPAWYLRLSPTAPRPDLFYDALLPTDSAAGGQPYQVEARGRLVLWVDLYVPRGAAAEEYSGTLTLSADDLPPWQASMKLKVYDLVLPDARSIAAVGGFDHSALLGRLIQHDGRPYTPTVLDRRDPAVRRGLLAIRQLMQVGHSHRLDLFDTRIHPVLKRDAGGEVRLDWSDYDAIVNPYLDGSAFADQIGCPVWPSPFTSTWPNPADYADLAGQSPYPTIARSVLELCREHFQTDDARNRVFLWPLRDASPSAAAYAEFLSLVKLIRSADPNTPILSELPAWAPPGAPWQPPPEYARSADMLAPPGHWLDRRGTARPDPNGPPVGAWLAPGYPPHFPSLGVLADPVDVRAIPWVAMKYGCPGLLVPDVLDWSPTPFERAGPLQTTLFYPGTVAGIEGVLPSVRLKWLRRGLQDVAYLQVLRQRGHADIARKLVDAMVRYAGAEAAGDHPLDGRLDGWAKDPELWATVRRILAEETQQVVNPTELTGRQLLEQRLAWQEVRRRTATVRIEQVRSRITSIATIPAGRKLVATFLMELLNEYDDPVAPVLRVGALPVGWRSLDGVEVRLEAIPPGARKTAVLSLEGPDMPLTTNAKMDVPLTFEFPDGRQTQVTVAVPFLMGGAAARSPKIDGYLDDWPLRMGNCAGDFAIVGRRGALGDGQAKRQTQAFALRDEQNLYIGIRCLEPNMALVPIRTDNLVHYEQLLACGEDLVEVLLDPGAKAKGPEDLYHIVVKPSGIVVAERGVAAASPSGKSTPWAADIHSAVTRRHDQWIVELAIPLEAFGPARAEPFWGVNFVRFSSLGQESSNWAQTPRNVYYPKNLGTLFVPPPARAPASRETGNVP